MLDFRQWFEQNAGEVQTTHTANTAVDDGFMKIRSKYIADNVPQRKKECEAEKLFGKRKRRMKHK